LRPPLAQERLSETNGKILYEMKRRFSDGTTHIVFEPLEFLEKLVALIPKPRAHQVLYHGVFAPHAKWRVLVILKANDAQKSDPKDHSAEPGNDRQKSSESEASPTATGLQAIRKRRLQWAELLRRVFAIDVLKCDKCGGNRTIVSAITEPDVIRAILSCLGLATNAKSLHPARAPPQSELCFP